MLLAVDIGNSQTSFGLFEQSVLKHHWRAQTNRSRTADEYAAFFFPLLTQHGLKGSDITGVALCSVVPAADNAFEQFCKSYWKIAPFKVGHESKIDFTLGIDFPEEIGADRLANAAYAVKHLKLPALVVDIGTATTFDVVSAAKVYSGGVILPGPRLAMEALGLGTSKLPMVNLEFPERVIGKNTVECIQAGILYGYCDLIDGLVVRTEKELGEKPEIILTGGFAGFFQDRLKTKARLLPNLTLEGTEILYRGNR